MQKLAKEVPIPYSEIEALLVEYLIERKDLPKNPIITAFDIRPEVNKNGDVVIDLEYVAEENKDVVS